MTISSQALSPASRIFVSIDTPEIASARGLAESLADTVGGIKLGLEFFVGQGPAGIRSVVSGIGLPLFIDLKLHDIPNTVAAAVRAMLPLQPTFLTIHTSGGPAMMRAAAEAALMTDLQRPRLLGVTVLTSLDDDDLVSVGQSVPGARSGAAAGGRWRSPPASTASSARRRKWRRCAPTAVPISS